MHVYICMCINEMRILSTYLFFFSIKDIYMLSKVLFCKNIRAIIKTGADLPYKSPGARPPVRPYM